MMLNLQIENRDNECGYSEAYSSFTYLLGLNGSVWNARDMPSDITGIYKFSENTRFPEAFFSFIDVPREVVYEMQADGSSVGGSSISLTETNAREKVTRTVQDSGSFGDTGHDTVEAGVIVAEHQHPARMRASAYVSSDIGVHSDLVDYFARPTVVANGVFATTDGPTTFNNYALMEFVMGNQMFIDKLKGKYLFRATVVMRLCVNANKFQQGRYILAWLPTGGMGSQPLASWIAMHRFSKTQITQLPHVEIDLATDSEIILRIPYTSFNLGYLQSNYANNAYIGDPGVVFIYPYSPLVITAGSSTASYVLWAHFEDVALEGVAIPQMAYNPKGNKDPIAIEQESQGIGPLTSTARKISTSAGLLSRIPLLSAIAAPVQWVADVFAGVAYVWGWSRPEILSPIKRVAQFPGAYNACTDVADTAMPLSLFARNHVGVLPGYGGNDVDEMSIDYLKSIPSYFAAFTWSASDVVNTVDYTVNVGPSSGSITLTSGITALYNRTPVCFLSSRFQFWRGSINFTFKFVKTTFHSGRLLIVFSPINAFSSAPAAASLSNCNYLVREIVDIREKNTVTVTVPYISDRAWTNYSVTIGKLSVIVMDPLVAPATVSSSIQVLIEMSGGDDFEVAVPIPSTFSLPTIPYDQQMAYDPSAGTNDVVSKVIGGASISSDYVTPSELCIGEKVSSLRSLLKKYTPIGSIAVSGTNKGISINTTAIDVGYTNAVAYGYPVFNSDTYGDLAICYALNRGGLRFRVLALNSSDTFNDDLVCMIVGDGRSTLLPTLSTNTITAVSMLNGYSGYNPPMQYFRGNFQQVEVQIPQYFLSHARPTGASIVNVNDSVGALPSTGEVPQQLLQVYTGTATACVQRAGADDLSFGCFVSIPPNAA